MQAERVKYFIVHFICFCTMIDLTPLVPPKLHRVFLANCRDITINRSMLTPFI